MLRFEDSPVVSILSTLEEVEDTSLLTGLDIRNLRDSFTRDEITNLFEKIISMDSLVSITFQNCKLKDADFESIVKVVSEKSEIAKIAWRSVSFCNNMLTDASISNFHKFLQIFSQNLEVLNIDGNLFSAKFHRSIVPLLPQIAPNLISFSALSSSFKTITVNEGCIVPNNLFLELMTITIELMGHHSLIRNISFSRYLYICDGILNIRHFPLITAESLGILTLLIHQVKSLKGIVCNHCSLSDDAMETFCEAISMQQETLVSIELKNNHFSDVGLHVLADAIKSCRKLTKINITGNNANGDGLRVIWNVALNYCRSLESFIANQLHMEPSARVVARMLGDFLSARLPLLCLHDLRIGSQCIVRRHSGMSNSNAMFTVTGGGNDDIESVSSATTIASVTSAPWEIVLHNIIFEDEDMRLFSIPLMRHTSIVSVTFERCQFSDKCLDDWARALAVNTSIERLYFIANMQHWTTTGVGFILKALETNRSLRWVLLDKAPADVPIRINAQSEYEEKNNVFNNDLTSTRYNKTSFQTPDAKFASPETPMVDHASLVSSNHMHHIPHYRTDRSPMFSAFKPSVSMDSALLVSFSDTFIDRFMSSRLPEVIKFVKRGTVYLHRPSIVSKFSDRQQNMNQCKKQLLMVSPMASLETDPMGDFLPFSDDRRQKRQVKWSQHRLQHRFLQRHQRNNLRFATQKITSMFRLAQVIQTPPLSPTSEENWLTVCVSDYSEEEFKSFLQLVFDASDRINLCYIRLTYVPFPCRYLLVPFLCNMLSNPHIAHNLDTLILGDFVHYDRKKLVIQDWDFSQNWVTFDSYSTEQSVAFQTTDAFEDNNEANMSTINAVLVGNDPLATPMKTLTPTCQLSPARKLSSTTSPSAKILMMTSPSDTNHSLMTPFSMTAETPLPTEQLINGAESIAKTTHTQQNSISLFFKCLSVVASKVHVVSMLTTDTDGIPLHLAILLLHHCVKNNISQIEVNIKEDELNIRALLEILSMLSTIDNNYQITINRGLVCVKNGEVRIEHNFFCRSRPRLQLSLPQLAHNKNAFLGKDTLTLKMENIQALEDVLVAMDIYVQDIVQVDPTLLTANDPYSSTSQNSLISKTSCLWIDCFNTWLQEHQLSIPTSFYEDAGVTDCKQYTKSFSPQLTFFPHVYVDNPRMRDPFDRIHRELVWTSFLLELDTSDADKIAEIVQQRSDISTLSFTNLRLSDNVLQKLMKTESNVLPTVLRRLRHLNLSHNSLTDASLKYLSSIFFETTETNIQTLDLSFNSSFTIQGILSFLASINKLRHTSLISLLLHHTIINEEKNAQYYKDSMSLIDYYPFFKDTSHLLQQEEDERITKPATVMLTQAMIDLLLTHSAIEHVSFTEHIHFTLNKLVISTNAHLLRQETQGIALVCASKSYITQLILRHNHLQDEQIVDLSAAIQFLTSLEILDVSHNLLSNVGMSLLAETLLIYGNSTTFRYVDFSYNNGHFAIPNVHQAIGYHVCQQSSLFTPVTNKFTSAWQPQRKLSYLRVIQCDDSWSWVNSTEKYRTKIYLKDPLTHLYEPYVFIQTKAATPFELQEQLMHVSFPEDISGGDILVDLSNIKVNSPTMRQQLDEFMSNSQKLYHQYQHNIMTNAPMCTMSLILDRTILDSSFYASFPKYIDGIVTFSLKNAAIDDTKAMHLEYALSRSGVNAASNTAATTLSDQSGFSQTTTSISSSASVASSLSTSSFAPSSLLNIQLRSLQLQGNLLTEVGAQALLACAGQSPSLSLRTISLADNPLMRDLTSGENLARFATKRLPSMVSTGQMTPALLSLDFSYTCIQDTTASLLARTLAHPHCLLEALNISFTQISVLAAMRLLQSLNTNRGLKILFMNGINMSSVQPALPAAVDHSETTTGPNTVSSSSSLRLNWKNSSLQSLSLRHCQLHPRVVHALLDSGIRSLEHLDLSHNQLPNVILMMVLLKLSTSFPQLHHLNLYPGTTQQSMSFYDQQQSAVVAEESSQGPSMSTVNAACTKEDIEMIALEILQEVESPLQKLVLYPFELTRELPKKTSDLMRCLYEDEGDHIQNNSCLYPDTEYSRHYYDSVAKKLTIVIRDEEDIELSQHMSCDIIDERQRVNRNLFQNTHFISAEEINFVLIAPVLSAMETKKQGSLRHFSSPFTTNSSSSTKISPNIVSSSLIQATLNKEHKDISSSCRFTIWQLFLQSIFFISSPTSDNNSNHCQLSLKRLTLQFSVLFEEDVIALCQTLRTLGKAIDALHIHINCGVFVPMMYKSLPVKKISYSASNAVFTGQSDATSLPRSSFSQAKRFTTPTKLRVPPSAAAASSTNVVGRTSPSTQKALSLSNFSSSSFQSHKLSPTAAISGTSLESNICSMMDALCLVPFISAFSICEIGLEKFHDGYWRFQVYPYLQVSGNRVIPATPLWNNTNQENSLYLNLVMTHFTPMILEGLASLIRNEHRLSQNLTLMSAVSDTSKTMNNPRIRDSRNTHPMRLITKTYMAKQAQRLEEQLYQPLRYSIAEKLLSALIPTSSSTNNMDMICNIHTSSFILQLPSPISQNIHDILASQADESRDIASIVEPVMNNMRQEIHLLDLLAMLLRRNASLKSLHISGVFTAHGNIFDRIASNSLSYMSNNTNNTTGIHRLLDFQEALSSVVAAVVQNDRSSLQQLSLYVPETVSLHQHAHLLAPYLPAHVNDLLQSPSENNENENIDENMDVENKHRDNNNDENTKWLSNEEVLTIIRNAFSSNFTSEEI